MTQTAENTPNPVTQDEIETWISLLDDMLAENHAAHGYTFKRDTVGYDWGRKYARVYTQRDTGGRSAFCFIRRADGAILKSAGWKRPAKHARGNIRAADPLAGVTPYGAEYL